MDGAALACVLLCLPALERHPAPEALLAVKDAPPCVGHQLLRCLLIGQALGAVIPQFRPDHLVQAFVAAALRQIFQRVLLQSPCALGVQRVVPVVVLVQHRAEDVLRTVAEEDPGRLGVHIGPDAPVVLQHIPQHSIRAGGRGVQADDLVGRVALWPHRTLVVYLAPAAGALAAKCAAQAGHLFGVEHPFALALGVGDLKGRPAGVGAQDIIDVRRRAAHAARQLQCLRKGGSAAPAQPVQRRRCGRVPVGVHPVRHIFADGLGCLVRHPPAFQRPLHLSLPLGLRRFRPESQSLPQRSVLVAVGFSCGGSRFTHVARCSHFRHDIGDFCGSVLYCLRHIHSFAGQLCALCSRRCFAFYVLLCGDLLQHPAGRARSVGQRHAVSLLKSRTVFPVLGVRRKQSDGLARQAVSRRHFGKLPHRRVFRFCGSLIYASASLCRKARHLTPRSTSGVQLRAARHASGALRPGCGSQRLLRRAAAAVLCSSARHFTSHRASGVQRKLARHASGSPLWGSCRRSRLRGLIPVQRSISRAIRSLIKGTRVAAPGVYFGPWAGLISCRPRPQQLLPVSATGGGRRCCPVQRFAHTVQP